MRLRFTSAMLLSAMASFWFNATYAQNAPSEADEPKTLGDVASKLSGHPIKTDRELSEALIASSNADDKNLGILIRFIGDSATLSGAVFACDARERRIYMQCAATIIANWKTLEKHDLPDVGSNGKSSSQVMDDMWDKQEAATKTKMGSPTSDQCADIVSRERKSHIWSICNRSDIEKASNVPPSADDNFSVNETLQ